MLRFSFISALAQTTHTAVTIRKWLLRLGHARVTGYTAFHLLGYRKFPLGIAFSKWKVFMRVCARFHAFSCMFSPFSCKQNVHLQRKSRFSQKRFRVNMVALVADDYEMEMKHVVCWMGVLRTLNGNFLAPVLSWSAMMTDLKRNGWPTLLYDRILAAGRPLFSSLYNSDLKLLVPHWKCYHQWLQDWQFEPLPTVLSNHAGELWLV